MKARLEPLPKTAFSFEIARQPNDTTCGPTCLQAVYRHYGLDLPMEQLLAEIPALKHGGTLAVILGLNALQHGFKATLYTYNLRFFDPTWFFPERRPDLAKLLREQVRIHQGKKRKLASRAYLKFVEAGGEILMEDLSPELLARHLSQQQPILTGLSSTWLYRGKREDPITCEEDDLKGVPTGHFVVLNGYDPTTLSVDVADPYEKAHHDGQCYSVPIMRLTNAVLLGILTYDANLLTIHPQDSDAG